MLKFSPEYGMITDVIAAMLYQCNPEKRSWVCRRMGLQPEGIRWIRRNLAQPKEELYLFFALCEGKKTSFFEYLFVTSGDELIPCTLRRFALTYCTVEHIRRKLMEFYLSVDADECTVFKLRRLIAASEYSVEIRFHLLGFLMDADGYVRVLNEYLKSCYFRVWDYHQRHEELVQRTVKEITFPVVQVLDRLLSVDTEYDTVYISVSLFARQALERRGLYSRDGKETMLLSLGVEWRKRRARYISQAWSGITVMRSILSEEKGVRLVRYLLKHERILVSEAAKLLGTTEQAANYQLNRIADYGLLRFLRDGDQAVFVLNVEYFDGMLELLQRVIHRIGQDSQ